MTQARRSEFEFDRDLLFVRNPPAQVAVATGHETPVASPALELQKALDEMFTATPVRRTDYVRGAALTAATVATVMACSAFWWTTFHWAAALIA